jgi:cyd operon protein YbgT
MWYFSWILGLGFACTLAVLNAIWLEQRTLKIDSAFAP